MKTYSQKPSETTRKWHLLDASQTSLGRVATVAARLLIGKDKPTVTSHVDGGDYVVIINADKLVVTGGKEEKKIYHNHSGFPGGLRSRPMKDIPSTEALHRAIRGMLPVNKLRDGRLARLKIYSGEEHNHTAQQPTVYGLNQKGAKLTPQTFAKKASDEKGVKPVAENQGKANPDESFEG